MPFVDGCLSFSLRTSILCVRTNQKQIPFSSMTATKMLFCFVIFFPHGLLFELFLFWCLIFTWHYTWADWCKTVYKKTNYKPCMQCSSTWWTQQVDTIVLDTCEWGVFMSGLLAWRCTSGFNKRGNSSFALLNAHMGSWEYYSFHLSYNQLINKALICIPCIIMIG